MLFVIRKDLQDFMQSCTWRGRCGAIHLPHRGTHNLMRLNLCIVGLHGAHGDRLVDTLADVAYLIRKWPFGSKVVVVGDFNVDMLPALELDPWADRADRGTHHADRRILLEAVADRFNLETNLPSMFHCPWRALLGASTACPDHPNTSWRGR